ncbi:hypothetical protein NA57DRAFT_59630 [Rhizodiscina lignyota]|uniref:Uncharacterized protein n=1 Tax=Rhizodiscina lignyota TaxID=1504668 RepID=A0A9P4IB22_9PEZI|nr:hypothetical protein NA57DRAFT_59630 [Rhizodiscina lignyota]
MPWLPGKSSTSQTRATSSKGVRHGEGRIWQSWKLSVMVRRPTYAKVECAMCSVCLRDFAAPVGYRTEAPGNLPMCFGHFLRRSSEISREIGGSTKRKLDGSASPAAGKEQQEHAAQRPSGSLPHPADERRAADLAASEASAARSTITGAARRSRRTAALGPRSRVAAGESRALGALRWMARRVCALQIAIQRARMEEESDGQMAGIPAVRALGGFLVAQLAFGGVVEISLELLEEARPIIPCRHPQAAHYLTQTLLYRLVQSTLYA